MKKAVIYIRVSTQEQVLGGSLDTQLRVCEEYASKNEYGVEKVYREEGESARTEERTQLQNMIAYCTTHRKEIDAVLVHRVDRFARNLEDFLSLCGIFKKLGIEVIPVTQETDNTPEGMLMLNFLAAWAQYDNDKRSMLTKDGMMDGVKEGRWLWRAPLGYVNATIDDKKVLILDERDPLLISLIKKAWDLIDAGYTEAEALRLLTKDGLRTVKGKPVSKQTFSRMLRRKLYMGVVESKSFEQCIESDVIPKIISESLWWRVYERLEGRKKGGGSSRLRINPLYPLKGHLRCPDGHVFRASAPKGRYPQYHCPKCGKKLSGQRIEKVHPQFIDYANNLSLDESNKEALYEAIRLTLKEHYEASTRAKNHLMKKLTDLDDKVEKILVKNLDGILDDEQAKILSKKCADEKKETQTKLYELEESIPTVDSVWNDGLEMLSNLGSTWSNIKDVNIKQRLQRWMFPEGLTYDGEMFGTQQIARSLSIKKYLEDVKSQMVPPTGLEPVFPP